MKPRILFPLALVCLTLPAAADVTVASPDGRVQFLLSAGAQGHLEYTVTFHSKNVIDQSPLGIVIDKVDLADGAQIGVADNYKISETYPWYGAHSTAVNNCNGRGLRPPERGHVVPGDHQRAHGAEPAH